jgi:uncharacterized membrane protein YdbT with pleckstrin-like domain
VEFHSRPHGAALFRPLGRAVLAAAAGAAAIAVGADVHWSLEVLGAAAIGFGAVSALVSVVEWERTHVVLTRDLLLVRWGVIRRHRAEVRLRSEQPVEIEQGVAGRLLGYGTLVAGEIAVPYVPLDGPGRT